MFKKINVAPDCYRLKKDETNIANQHKRIMGYIAIWYEVIHSQIYKVYHMCLALEYTCDE